MVNGLKCTAALATKVHFSKNKKQNSNYSLVLINKAM